MAKQRYSPEDRYGPQGSYHVWPELFQQNGESISRVVGQALGLYILHFGGVI